MHTKPFESQAQSSIIVQKSFLFLSIKNIIKAVKQ